MSFEPTGSRHSFGGGDLVSTADGLRGVVHDATALYATLRWEDGREEEVEQGDPRVTVEPAWFTPDEESGAWYRDATVEHGVEAAFDLWSKAGPSPSVLARTPEELILEALVQ